MPLGLWCSCGPAPLGFNHRYASKEESVSKVLRLASGNGSGGPLGYTALYCSTWGTQTCIPHSAEGKVTIDVNRGKRYSQRVMLVQTL